MQGALLVEGSSVSLLLSAILSTLGVGLTGLGLALRAHRRSAQLVVQLDRARAEINSLEQRLAQVERAAREQAVVEVVLGSLLVEKGIVDEEEIEEVHHRLVVEPAIAEQENEALLAALPDREGLRERMIRNCGTTVQ